MHEPGEWLAKYQRAGEAHDVSKMKELEKQIFLETVDLVTIGRYTSVSGREITFPDPSFLIKNSVLYDSPIKLGDCSISHETEYAVVNQDCLLAGRNLREEGFDPIVLNMANQFKPGGGVIHGDRAQEESIFRRSNIFLSLYQFAPYARKYGLKPRMQQYPMADRYGGAYSPNVIVFRGERSEGYPLLDDPYVLSFVTVAALCNPELTFTGHLTAPDLEETRKRAETILRIALSNGHDAIVLSAWGCGAFHNPPADIARLFHEALESPDFKGRFKKVVFAIIGDHHAQTLGDKFEAFQREFE